MLQATSGPTRRAVLVGALVLATAAACSDSAPPPPSGKPGEVPRDDPDRPVLDVARADTLTLLREYDAALIARPELAKDLRPLREAHQAHLQALGQPGVDAAPSPTPTLGAESKAALLRRLAAAEKATAGKRVTQCKDLRSGALARIVAAVGGAEAAHASLLRELGGAG